MRQVLSHLPKPMLLAAKLGQGKEKEKAERSKEKQTNKTEGTGSRVRERGQEIGR